MIDKAETLAAFQELLASTDISSLICFARTPEGNVQVLRKIPLTESLGEWNTILSVECFNMIQFLSRPPKPESSISTPPKSGLILV